ncbi:MAG: hypothetical protein IJX84_07590 [Clostridia bacterium]|nr:hypothetical protein [Clostridia bacterium]
MQIANEDWMQANKTLKPFGLQLYLYLAANNNEYQFALSPAAAEEYAGIKSTTFHKYLRLLEIEGYLVWRKGNLFDFYTSPREPKDRTHPDEHFEGITFEETSSVPRGEDPISDGEVSESVSRSVTSPDELPLSSRDSLTSPPDKEIDNRKIDKDREERIDNIDAGTPRTPAAPDAGASGLPSKAEVECSRISTQPPKRKLFAFLDEDEFDF